MRSWLQFQLHLEPEAGAILKAMLKLKGKDAVETGPEISAL